MSSRTPEQVTKDVYAKFEKDALLKKSPSNGLTQTYASISLIGPDLPQKHEKLCEK